MLLYRALAGELPFDGTVEEVMEGHRREEPRRPSAFDPALRAYDDIVMRLLAKRPRQRYPDTEEVRAALRSVPPPP